MRKLMTFVGAVLTVVIMTGCGHNVINYGDGVGFDAGINPENGTFSFNLRYGKILSAVTRDNVEIEMNGAATANGGMTTSGKPSAEGQTAGIPGNGNVGINTDGALKVKIGRQINGYTVDAIKAGADSKQIMDMK